MIIKFFAILFLPITSKYNVNVIRVQCSMEVMLLSLPLIGLHMEEEVVGGEVN